MKADGIFGTLILDASKLTSDLMSKAPAAVKSLYGAMVMARSTSHQIATAVLHVTLTNKRKWVPSEGTRLQCLYDGIYNNTKVVMIGGLVWNSW